MNFGVEEQKNKLRELSTAISNAKHVLIVGGGIIGVETAGEIASKYRNTKVHSSLIN